MVADTVSSPATVAVEQRHLAEDVREIRSRLTSMEGTTHEINVRLAELTGKFATVDAVLKLTERVSELEAVLNRGKGGMQAVWVTVGILFTLANLLIASYGKFWS